MLVLLEQLMYILFMNAEQFSKLQDSLGVIWEYEKRWKDTTYVDYTLFIPENGIYYVVLYNKNLLFKRTVDVQITIDYYYDSYDPDPYNKPTENIFWSLLFYVVIPIVVIVLVIAIPIILVRRYKRKSPKEPIML